MEGFFGFSKPFWQIALRTTLVYLALVILTLRGGYPNVRLNAWAKALCEL
ncbi:hypothetical protein [Sorangium sp. So ce385]